MSGNTQCKPEFKIRTPCFSLLDWVRAQIDPPTYQQALDVSGWTIEQLQEAVIKSCLGLALVDARIIKNADNVYSVESDRGLNGMYILATEHHVGVFSSEKEQRNG